jgi:ABC-type Zn uptake system ZnuABC Zn-binding protein ZnuA
VDHRDKPGDDSFCVEAHWIASRSRAMTSDHTMRLHKLLLAFSLAAGLTAPPTQALAEARIRLVTTTTDLRSLAEAVGGDLVEATSLVPANFDAEEYQPRPQDVLRLKEARLVVRVGLDYDLWFDRLLDASGRRDLRRGGEGYVDASFAIAPLEVRGVAVGPGDGHAHGSGNPHYWLDPKNAEIITANLLDGLARADPRNAPIYEANRVAFLGKLGDKLKAWEYAFAAMHGVPLVAYHNSWAYLARRFRLDFIGTIEPKPGVAPSPAQLAALIGSMNEHGARIIVRQPHEPEKDVTFVAKHTGGAIAVLAASVGAMPAARDYLSLFDADATALLAAAAKR